MANAGTTVETYAVGGVARATNPCAGEILVVTLAWTSTAGGVVTFALTRTLVGTLQRVDFVPGATTPTAAYDITITNADSIDVLAGQGANLSETTATSVCPGVPLKDGTTTSTVPRALSDDLTLNITNAGNAKTGTVRLYVKL